MVNFHDPAVVASDTSALVNLFHTFAGLYIWEFAVTLGYEWSIIWGRRPHVWTIWIYSFTRVATLVAVLLTIADFNLKARYSCQALLTLYTVSACLAISTAELLIVLRVIAIWNKKRSIMTIAIGVWVINGAFLIQVMARLRSRRSASGYCLPRNIEISKLHGTSTLVTDVVLLLTMLVGLLRLRVKGVGMLSLGRFLWKQGIIWFFIATAAEALPMIFVFLDLNDPWNIMFRIPSLITISIAATRIYRSLSDFVSGLPDVTQVSLQRGNGSSSRFWQSPGTHVPLKQLEVAVHSTRVQCPTPQASDCGSCIMAREGQVVCKPNGLTTH